MNEIEFLMYEADAKIEVIVKDETIWATQKAIAGLFDVGVPAISKHLKNIFESGELDEKVLFPFWKIPRGMELCRGKRRQRM